MILSLALSVALAQPFTRLGGTGSFGGGESHRPALVDWVGDSLTQGACSGTAPPAVLDGLLPGGSSQGYVVVNSGHSGETPHQIHIRVRSEAATACLGGPCGYYVVHGMVNILKNATYDAYAAADVAAIAVHGSSATNSGTCNTSVTDDCGLMDTVDWLHTHQANARIFAIGMLPYASCDVGTCGILVEPGPRSVAADAALVAACSTRPWLTCIFPYNSFRDGTTHNLSPTYACASDFIHLKQAGSTEFARQVYASATW